MRSTSHPRPGLAPKSVLGLLPLRSGPVYRKGRRCREKTGKNRKSDLTTGNALIHGQECQHTPRRRHMIENFADSQFPGHAGVSRPPPTAKMKRGRSGPVCAADPEPGLMEQTGAAGIGFVSAVFSPLTWCFCRPAAGNHRSSRERRCASGSEEAFRLHFSTA